MMNTRASLMHRPTTVTDPFRTMERFVGDLFRPGALGDLWQRESLADRAWMPAVDIAENETGYVVTAELPGVSKDEVSITFEAGVLTLSGERRFEEKQDGKNYHRIERAYGSFSRSFVLPAEVNADKVEANFQDGVLTVSVPKAEQAKPRKISIS